MKKKLLLSIGLMVSCAAAMSAQVQIGSKIPDFTLADLEGKSQTMKDLEGSKGLVMIFVSIQCPVVRGYNERMNEIAKAYKAKGINLVGIDSNFTESASEVKAHALTTWSFPILLDPDSKIADRFGASVTPEAYYIDAADILLYHGAIDNDRTGRNVTEKYLQAAFDTSLSGMKINRTSANAFGCSIRRASAQ